MDKLFTGSQKTIKLCNIEKELYYIKFDVTYIYFKIIKIQYFLTFYE